MSGISIIVITRNEAANIAACLESVAFADEVIVLDSGSTDATIQIAAASGARVVQAADWPGFGPQKNRALDLATRDWVLSIDADERVGPGLRDEILRAIAAPDAADAWSMPRLSSFCGRFMRHGGWYPDRVVRLFRRGSARFSDDIVHERLVTTGRVGQLRGHLLHHTYPTLGDMLEKMNRYSSAGAETMARRRRPASPGRAVLHGAWAFIRSYVLRRGFLDGWMGFALAVSIAEAAYYKHLKAWLLASPWAETAPEQQERSA
jgi:glycosyltransferase involved in cell wall biosynthesis